MRTGADYHRQEVKKENTQNRDYKIKQETELAFNECTKSSAR